MASSSFGPTPDTLSSRLRLPNGPCSVRHATIRCASAGPTRGNRVISLTSARSTSMRSPGNNGRASCAARLAVSRNAFSRGVEEDWSCTSPGGADGDGERKCRTPAPANARQASSRAARRSSIYTCVVRGTWCVERSCVVRRASCVGVAGGFFRRRRNICIDRPNRFSNSMHVGCGRYSSSSATRTRHSASAAEPKAILRCLPQRAGVPSA